MCFQLLIVIITMIMMLIMKIILSIIVLIILILIVMMMMIIIMIIRIKLLIVQAGHQHLLLDVQDQLMTCTSMYVEEQLLSQFGSLIGFVKRAEAAQKHKGAQAEGVPLPGYGPNEAAPVLQDFASRWQPSIDALHK